MKSTDVCACGLVRCTNPADYFYGALCPKCKRPKHRTCGVLVDPRDQVYWCFECHEGPSTRTSTRMKNKSSNGEQAAKKKKTLVETVEEGDEEEDEEEEDARTAPTGKKAPPPAEKQLNSARNRGKRKSDHQDKQQPGKKKCS